MTLPQEVAAALKIQAAVLVKLWSLAVAKRSLAVTSIYIAC